MSILIKGMDKPKTCWDCVKHFDIECNGNIQDCPIVEVDDRKTEPQTEIKVEPTWVGTTYGRFEDEPQTETKNSNENSNVILVNDGVTETVRCAMCNNPNKSDRGCDGACSYDEVLYKKIIDAIHECVYKPKDEPQTDCAWK